MLSEAWCWLLKFPFSSYADNCNGFSHSLCCLLAVGEEVKQIDIYWVARLGCYRHDGDLSYLWSCSSQVWGLDYPTRLYWFYSTLNRPL